MKLFSIIAMILLNFHCSSIRRNESTIKTNKNKELANQNKSNQNSALEDLELKQTKLWARISELEDIVTKQKERLALIERHINIDVVSEENHEKSLPTIGKKEIEPIAVDTKIVVAPKKISKEEYNTYKKDLEKGKTLFKKEDYGNAFLIFSEIDKKISSDVSQGEPLYWIARCWFKLKEFQSSKKILESFVEKFPNHPFVPTAKYFQAKADIELGSKENAIAQLKILIQEHPHYASIKAAKSLLAKLEATP